MWRGMLKKQNIPSIYIDAFANDYSDDAFIVIASAITEFVKNKNSKDSYTELLKNTKRVGIQLLSRSARVGIKAATLGIIKDGDIDALGDMKDEIAKGVSGWVGDLIEERLESHSEGMNLIQSFRGLISSIPAKLKDSDGKPLVVILDELDRCKPTFAVDAVEKIKHLFSVQNVVFVLVMNKTQLEQSVKIIYGQELDAHTYLQKFINLETRIPKRSSVLHMNDASKYIRKLVEQHEFKISGDKQIFINDIEFLAIHLNLTLRQLEKVSTTLVVFYNSVPENHLHSILGREPLIVFLAVVKVVDPLLFENCLVGRTSYIEVSERFGFLSQESDSEQWPEIDWLKTFIKYFLYSDKEYADLNEDHKVRKFGRSERMSNVNRKQLLLTVSQWLGYFIIE